MYATIHKQSKRSRHGPHHAAPCTLQQCGKCVSQPNEQLAHSQLWVYTRAQQHALYNAGLNGGGGRNATSYRCVAVAAARLQDLGGHRQHRTQLRRGSEWIEHSMDRTGSY